MIDYGMHLDPQFLRSREHGLLNRRASPGANDDEFWTLLLEQRASLRRIEITVRYQHRPRARHEILRRNR